MSSSSNILPRKSLLQGILHSSIILDSLPRVGLIFVSSSGILVFTCVCHRLPVSAFTRLLTPYYHDSHLHRSQNEWVVAPTDCCIATRLLSERTTASGACHRSVWCVAVACLVTGPRGKQPTRRGKKAASSVQISDCCPNELWVLELASVWF